MPTSVSAVIDDVRDAGAVPVSGRARMQAVFVGGCWLLTVLSLLVLVARHGEDFPFYDDFELVPFITGDATLTPSFLWSQHGEHRLFLPRLVYVLAARAAGGRLRAVEYLDALLLSGFALAAILTARRLRGRIRYPDALLALVCIGPTHAGCVLWSYEIQFVLTTALAGVLLLAIAHSGERLGARTAELAGLATALLPLCGGNGLVLTPLLTLWLFVRAGYAARSGQRGAAVAAGVLGLFTTTLAAAYLVGYATPADRHSPDVTAFLRTTIQLWASSGGIGARELWPASGVAAVGMLLLATWLGLRAGTTSLARRGLLLFLLAFAMLAAGTAWGRAGVSSSAGWDPRYVTLLVPLVVAIDLVLVASEPDGFARAGQTALLALILIVVPFNVREGRRHWQAWSAMYAGFKEDVAAGMPARLLAIRHHGPPMAGLYPRQDVLEDAIGKLQRAGMSGLGDIAKEYGGWRIDEVPFDGKVISATQATWEGGHGVCSGPHSSLVFQLPAPRHVYAIRFTASYSDRADGTLVARLRAFWTLGDRPFTEAQAITRDVPRFAPEVTIWMDTTVDRLRIDPDIGPCQFEYTGMTMIVPGS